MGVRLCDTVVTCYLITVIRQGVGLGVRVCSLLEVLSISLLSEAPLMSLLNGDRPTRGLRAMERLDLGFV